MGIILGMRISIWAACESPLQGFYFLDLQETVAIIKIIKEFDLIWEVGGLSQVFGFCTERGVELQRPRGIEAQQQRRLGERAIRSD